MAENLGKWPSGHRKTEKSGHRMAAEGIQFPWRWYGGTISTNLDVIWGMSVDIAATMDNTETSAPSQDDLDARPPPSHIADLAEVYFHLVHDLTLACRSSPRPLFPG